MIPKLLFHPVVNKMIKSNLSLPLYLNLLQYLAKLTICITLSFDVTDLLTFFNKKLAISRGKTTNVDKIADGFSLPAACRSLLLEKV